MERKSNYSNTNNKYGAGNSNYPNPEYGEQKPYGRYKGNQDKENYNRASNSGRGGNGASQFNSKPVASPHLNSLVPKSVNLVTNQYMMTLGSELNVYYYDISISPETISDSYVIHGVIRNCKRKLDMMLGMFVISGRNIFTTTDISESILIKSEFKSQEYDVVIDADTKKFISGKHVGKLKMEDHSIVHNLINIIIKQAFRDTNLRQIGKAPRFFDVTRAVTLEGSGLQMWPGFRASAFNYQSGLTLVIDNIAKFMSTTTCLQRMNEIVRSAKTNPESQILREFKGQSVIANWGNKKAYIIRDVIFDKTPVTKFFTDNDGKKMSVAEYFLKTYNLKTNQKDQPLFVVNIGGKECHLPPEFCTIDGVPESIRQDPFLMRGVLGSCRKNPTEKFNEIQKFCGNLFDQQALKDWGISIKANPVSLQSQILPCPQVSFENGSKADCDQNLLRKLPIQKAIKLEKGSWIMAYDKNRHFKEADNVYNGLMGCAPALNTVVEEPEWMELNREDEFGYFDEYLQNYIKQFGVPQLVLLVLRNENFYGKFKAICYKYNCISQVVAVRTCRKFNLSIASNIMRQINSKLGGDLYNLSFSNDVSPNTMLIGIDVCHQGDNSIVGFCASINSEMSQYYSQKIVQKRGQEIVNNELTAALKSALNSFSEKHPKNAYPDHFIIYRDGVGDAMRKQVLQKEITQFRAAINEVYNKAAKKPHITVIIVNKRITQRFFVQDSHGNLNNPPSGCIVDTKLVENDDSDFEYDFFLIPSYANQGCVLPTHFYVAFNDSPLKKAVIEKLTFDLCHYYYNWAGPIKVPAPCMYAHKIAELFTNVDPSRNKDCTAISARIFESLHFL